MKEYYVLDAPTMHHPVLYKVEDHKVYVYYQTEWRRTFTTPTDRVKMYTKITNEEAFVYML